MTRNDVKTEHYPKKNTNPNLPMRLIDHSYYNTNIKDIDYLHKLSPIERLWLDEFLMNDSGNGPSSDKTDYNNKNSRQRCVMNRGSFITIESIAGSKDEPRTEANCIITESGCVIGLSEMSELQHLAMVEEAKKLIGPDVYEAKLEKLQNQIERKKTTRKATAERKKSEAKFRENPAKINSDVMSWGCE